MNDFLTPEYCQRHYDLVPPVEIGRLLAALGERSSHIRGETRFQSDVRYGDGERETMDVFRPAGRSRAVLIFIHGGLWQFGDKSQFSFPAAAWTSVDVTYVAINYSLVPAVPIETQLAQCRRAAAHVHRHASAFGVDPGRIFVAGHSSGGHLAALLMATHWSAFAPDLPDRVLTGGLTLSGVHDLEAIRRTAFMNAVLTLDERRVEELSPARHPAIAGVRVCSAVGGLENVEFQRQTRVLCDAWSSTLHESLVLPGVDHFTILDQFGERGSELFGAAARMIA